MKDKVGGDKYTINNSQIGAVGRNAKSINKIQQKSPSKKKSENILKEKESISEVSLEFKQLLLDNDIRLCLNSLLNYFKGKNNKSGFNQVVLQLGLLKEIEDKQSKHIWENEEYHSLRGKIVESTLYIIDNELE